MPARVLVLGGTSEAGELVRALAPHADRFALTLSLAGRTRAPKPAPVPSRVGGFGGAQGLADYLVAQDIARVVDATHPFAARISANAALACAATGRPLLAIRRPPWQPVTGDSWHVVADMAAAAAALGPAPRRVFLTIGRQELAAFAVAPQHRYLVRTIEPVGDALHAPHLDVMSARGPFTQADEAALMRACAVEVVVSKNAGGEATYAKIAAARSLGLPVIMVARPDKPAVPSVPDAAGARARLLDGTVSGRAGA